MLYRPLTPTARLDRAVRGAAASMRRALDNFRKTGRDARYLDDAPSGSYSARHRLQLARRAARSVEADPLGGQTPHHVAGGLFVAFELLLQFPGHRPARSRGAPRSPGCRWRDEVPWWQSHVRRHAWTRPRR